MSFESLIDWVYLCLKLWIISDPIHMPNFSFTNNFTDCRSITIQSSKSNANCARNCSVDNRCASTCDNTPMSGSFNAPSPAVPWASREKPTWRITSTTCTERLLTQRRHRTSAECAAKTSTASKWAKFIAVNGAVETIPRSSSNWSPIGCERISWKTIKIAAQKCCPVKGWWDRKSKRRRWGRKRDDCVVFCFN